MSNKIGRLLGMATALTVSALLLFSTNVAYAQFSYWTGEGEVVNVPNDQIVSNGDGTLSIISAEEAAARAAAAAAAAAEQEQAANCDPAYPDVCLPPAPPDLDCGVEVNNMKDIRTLSPDPHRLDRDKDGLGCDSVVTTAETVTEEAIGEVTEQGEAAATATEATATHSAVSQIIAEIQIAISAINNGNVADAETHIDNAIALLPTAEPQVQPETEPEVTHEEEPTAPTEPETIVEEAEEQVPAETPIGTVQGNAVFVEQLNLEAAGIFQECIDALVAASVVFIVGQAVQNAETPEEVEAITNNTEAITEAVQNNTEITETVVDVVGENLGEIVSNQTTIEEVFEEEVAPEIEDDVIEIEEITI